MVQAKSTFTILDDVLHLDRDEEMEDPAFRQLTDGIRSLKLAVDGASQDFGVATTTAALITVAANMAIGHGDWAVVADALRQNMKMREVGAQVGFVSGTA